MKYNKQNYIASLKAAYGEFDNNFYVKENAVGDITEVAVIGKGVKDIEQICQCPTIQELNVSHNKIEVVTPLYKLTSIKKLDISHNKIIHLFGIASNSLIETINAENNKISERLSYMVTEEAYNNIFKHKPISYVSEYYGANKVSNANTARQIREN